MNTIMDRLDNTQSLSRLFFLGLISILLSYTVIFVPFPLIVAVLIYGRVKGYLTALVCFCANFYTVSEFS